RAPGAEGAEERVDGALHRPQCRHYLRAEAPELLPDQLDIALALGDGAPDLLECVGDARTGGERIGACLGESASESPRVALKRDDDGAHPTCHVRLLKICAISCGVVAGRG